MEIQTISRTISGNNFDNISATANVGENDNPIEIAKKLDDLLHHMLSAIKHNQELNRKREQKKYNLKSKLEMALSQLNNGCDADDLDIPF